MDGQRFDRLTRAFAQGINRRTLLKLLGGGTLAAAAGTTVFHADRVAAQGGPGDPCAPGTLPCAEGLLCAAEQEGVCYCEDPSEPWRGCGCNVGTEAPCGGTSLLCCPSTAIPGSSGICTSSMTGCNPTGCSEPDSSCENTGCCTEGECEANGWCTSCLSGTENPCGNINEAFSVDFICCTYGGDPGAVGTCVAEVDCIVEPPNTGAGATSGETNWIAPAAAIGAAAAVIAYKGRNQARNNED